MEYKKIFWGLILILIGLLLLLKNLDIIYFSWHAFWHLWPVILLLWGISILPVKDLWKIVLTVVVLAATVMLLIRYQNQNIRPGFRFYFHDHDEEESTGWDSRSQDISEPYDSGVRVATLHFDAAAGEFIIRDTSSKLIEFNKTGHIGNYSMELQNHGDSVDIDLKLKSARINEETKGNDIHLKLNPRPLWLFDLDAGAASVEMDLSPYKVVDFQLDGGASSIDIRLGGGVPQTTVDLEAGASSVKIQIPKESGCQVKTNTFLSNRTLDGFTKLEKNTWQTENYTNSSHKVIISLEAAISNLEVIRY